LRDILAAIYYRHILETVVQLALEVVPLATRRQMWIQCDDTHPHFGKEIVEYLNRNYQGSWIVRGGLSAWPAEAPGIKTLDFFLWSFMKYRVYHSNNPETIQYVAECLVEATAGIRNETVPVGTLHGMIPHSKVIILKV
jgi:hypothetical protein